MSEENKKVELSDDQLEKVVGGCSNGKKISLKAGYYEENVASYYHLLKDAEGSGNWELSVQLYKLQGDGYLHLQPGLNHISLGKLSTKRRVAREEMPPIR